MYKPLCLCWSRNVLGLKSGRMLSPDIVQVILPFFSLQGLNNNLVLVPRFWIQSRTRQWKIVGIKITLN